MKKFVIIVCTVCSLGFLVVLFQLGPSLSRSGPPKVLDSLKLPDGTAFYLVARHSGGWVDPYDIYFYRRDSADRIFVCGVDSETAYWWAAKLRLMNQDRIEIRDMGLEAHYSITDETLTLLRGNFALKPRLIDGSSLVFPIPSVVQKGIVD